jgi:hypothetical protein
VKQAEAKASSRQIRSLVAVANSKTSPEEIEESLFRCRKRISQATKQRRAAKKAAAR